MGKQKTAVMEEEPKDFLDDLLTPEEPILEEQTPLEEGEEQEKEEVKTPLEEGEEEEQDKLSKEEEEKQKEEITAEDLERELSQDEINELTPEQKGIFYGIQKERKKRQAAEQKAAYYQTQLQYGNKQTIVGNEQQEKQEPIFSNEEDEEYLTKRDFLAFQQKQTELSQQRELQRHNQQIQETARLEMLETQARAKYTDYDERYQLALEVVRTNPAMKATLDNMFFHNEANPAEFMYEIAKLSPSFGRKKVEEKEKGNTFTKIVRNAEKAKTTVGITNSGGKASADYDSMSNEELGNYLSRLSEDSYYRVPLKYRKKALKI